MKFGKELPEHPSFDYLKREARAMKSRHRNRDLEAAILIGHFDTSLHGLTCDDVLSRKFSILDAQRVVARQFGLGSWAKLKRYVMQSAVEAEIADITLATEVKRRSHAVVSLVDQMRRQSGNEKKKRLALLDDMTRDNSLFLAPVFDQYGWPGPDIVGRAGVEACSWVVANAWQDGELQFRSASLMKEAFACGDVPGPVYASTVDRCLKLSIDKTLYGSTHECCLEDEFFAEKQVLDSEGLDRRRAIAGLAPHKHFYAETIQLGKEEGWLSNDPEKDTKHKNDTASKGGYAAAADKYKDFIDSLV